MRSEVTGILLGRRLSGVDRSLPPDGTRLESRTSGVFEIAPALLHAGLQRLMDALVEDGVAQLDRPHLMVVRGARGERLVGPFRDGISAAVAADQEVRANAQLPAGERRAVEIVPLLEPVTVAVVDRPRGA